MGITLNKAADLINMFKEFKENIQIMNKLMCILNGEMEMKTQMDI